MRLPCMQGLLGEKTGGGRRKLPTMAHVEGRKGVKRTGQKESQIAAQFKEGLSQANGELWIQKQMGGSSTLKGWVCCNISVMLSHWLRADPKKSGLHTKADLVHQGWRGSHQSVLPLQLEL